MIYYILLVILIIIFMLFFIANYFFNLAINAKRDKSKALQAEHNKLEVSEVRMKLLSEGEEWYKNIEKEVVFITSRDKLKLHGNIIINENKTNKWVVVCHGYVGNINQIISGAKIFYDMGFNLLLIDSRANGDSEGNYIGMGILEKNDVIDWIGYLNNRYEDIKIILFGISMGAATVMMCSSEEIPNVKAIIEDCGYTSVLEEFVYQVKSLYKIPAYPIVKTLSVFTRIRAGYWLEEAAPIEHVKKSKLPILFIHGDKDTFVPTHMVYKLYESANCKKEKLIVKDAGHGASCWRGLNEYWETIKVFIDNNI